MNRLEKLFINIQCILFALFSIGIATGQSLKSSVLTEGMILIQGGKVQIGSDDGADNEKPSFYTHIRPFWLDKNPVTVAQFRKFVRVTRYITTAEKLGKGRVWSDSLQAWEEIKGANWEYPAGSDKPAAEGSEPVRQISWVDAKAYSNWIGKRLPSEFEMEKALKEAQKAELTFADGSLGQWCENWYTGYSQSSYFKRELNPQKTIKWSVLPHSDKQTLILKPSTRTSAIPETVYFNLGFRCATDVE
jgi:formylglycine-generating enzyme required for sulfatase activity